jgi:carbamoyltransferase
MIILGINISHDASSCLIEDGNIVYYCEEERVSKKKHHFPSMTNYQFYGIEKLKKFNIKEIDHLIFVTYGRDNENEDLTLTALITDQIKKANIVIHNHSLNIEEHHLYHAYSGHYLSGFDHSATIVMDGAGAYLNSSPQHREVESIYYFDNNIKTIYKHYSNFNIGLDKQLKVNESDDLPKTIFSNSYSPGSIFGNFTKALGFKNIGADAGKTMGMSSYGKLKSNTIEWFDLHKDNYFFNINTFNELIKTFMVQDFNKKADIAKKIQFETKEYTLKMIEKTIQTTQTKNIVLSGGYFLNCVNNYEYIKEFPNINFYVDPIAYDGGTAIGGCLYIWHNILGNENKLQKLSNLYLGG